MDLCSKTTRQTKGLDSLPSVASYDCDQCLYSWRVEPTAPLDNRTSTESLSLLLSRSHTHKGRERETLIPVAPSSLLSSLRTAH